MMKKAFLWIGLAAVAQVALIISADHAVADSRDFSFGTLKQSAEFFNEERSRRDQVKAILGEQNEHGVRLDLLDPIRDMANFDMSVIDQLHVHAQAHDQFMLAQDADEAYDAYLLMTAVQYCLSSYRGIGRSGANRLVLTLAGRQINSDARRMAVVRSESMMSRGTYPPLNAHPAMKDYCQYTTASH